MLHSSISAKHRIAGRAVAGILNCGDQALAQLCAFCSPQVRSVSAMGIFRKLRIIKGLEPRFPYAAYFCDQRMNSHRCCGYFDLATASISYHQHIAEPRNFDRCDLLPKHRDLRATPCVLVNSQIIDRDRQRPSPNRVGRTECKEGN